MVCNGGGDRCGCGEDGFLPCRIGKNKKMYVYWVFLCLFPKKIYRFMGLLEIGLFTRFMGLIC